MYFCLALASPIAILVELETEEPLVNLYWFIVPLAIKRITGDGNKAHVFYLTVSLLQMIIRSGC